MLKKKRLIRANKNLFCDKVFFMFPFRAGSSHVDYLIGSQRTRRSIRISFLIMTIGGNKCNIDESDPVLLISNKLLNVLPNLKF